ncbi:group III truncated hemoglobin [Faecalibacter rhinopitheci]|uniref:Group III truncated hemoglobin n=1 Tax=Faecalibacter rhinopitheci TaxID=2779678 RepID=A0A8J7K3B6_9FLAO|nr:group III truncated hemoglobin [Faecalibacter rhinopitheci]MBF0596348.1 group III truncated hemoglobin [Faecalibacter rhinopitheci]MBQ0147746.1 group III truncated hemoglobin [Candidatus Onthonaster equi]
MKKDISNTEDITLLVHNFYDLVIKDDLIGTFFTVVADVNWVDHLPHMIQFWETVLLGKASFEGWPMRTHLMLNKKAKMKPEHFDRWILLWNGIIDENFEGEIATEAKSRAKIMRDLILFKIEQQANRNIIQ